MKTDDWITDEDLDYIDDWVNWNSERICLPREIVRGMENRLLATRGNQDPVPGFTGERTVVLNPSAISVHPSVWDGFYDIPDRCHACIFPDRNYKHSDTTDCKFADIQEDAAEPCWACDPPMGASHLIFDHTCGRS